MSKREFSAASGIIEVSIVVKAGGKLLVNNVSTVHPEILLDHVISLFEVVQDYCQAEPDTPIQSSASAKSTLDYHLGKDPYISSMNPSGKNSASWAGK